MRQRHVRSWLRSIAAILLAAPLVAAATACDDDGGQGPDAGRDTVLDGGSDGGDDTRDLVDCADDDQDCDGVPAATDCDDDDASVYPDAPDNAGLGQWSDAPVGDISFTSRHSALALDATGRLHVALISESEETAYHAQSDIEPDGSLTWTIEPAATFDFSPRDAAIAVAPDGTVHITVEDQIDSELEHLWRTPGGTWQRAVIESGSGDTGRHSALAVADDGTVHLSFVGEGGALRYGRWDGGGWTVRELIPGTEPSARTSLVRTRDGHLFVARGEGVLADVGESALQLAISADDGDSWQVHTVPDALAVGSVSLALAPDGQVHLALYDSGSNRSRWLVVAPDGSVGTDEEAIVGGGLDLSLAIDAEGMPHIAYQQGSDLLWTRRTARGTWQQATVEDRGEAGTEPALAVASDGSALHVVFGANGGLHHAMSALPDGIDQSCDGIDGVDADADGVASVASGGGDCDDDEPTVNPGMTDTFGDAIDQDCDGVDGVDLDGDGFAGDGGGDCDDSDPLRHPDQPDDIGDDIDQNCDGVDGRDRDGDGFALRTSAGGTDCDDNDADIYVGADDPWGDDIDQDCDGVDGVDLDADGFAGAEGGGPDCNDADPDIAPGRSDNLWLVETLLPDLEQSHGSDIDELDAAVAADGRIGLVIAGSDVNYFEIALDGSLTHELLTDEFWGDPPGIVFDTADRPHVGFIGDGLQLHHATRDASGVWSRALVAPEQSTGGDSAVQLAMTPSGEIQALFREQVSSTEATLRHATLSTDGTWQVDLIDDQLDGSIQFVPLGIDSQGQPVTLITDPLRLLHRDASGTWTLEPIEATIGVYADLEVDGSDGVHIALQGPSWTFRHVHRPVGGDWTVTELPTDDGTNHYARLLIDAQDRAQIAWLRYGRDDWQLRHSMQRPDGSFETVILERQSDEVSGVRPALVQTPDGTLHMFFAAESALRHARTGAPADGVDQNCDGIDGIDHDGDGLASLLTGGTDCDDNDAAVGACP